MSSSTRSAATSLAAGVGERRPLRLEFLDPAWPAPTTKSTSDISGFRRSTVSAVMRAPTMIENAWLLRRDLAEYYKNEPIPSPDALEPAIRVDGVELEFTELRVEDISKKRRLPELASAALFD